MPRKPRLFVSGGIYHAYCRTHRGEERFSNKSDADFFIETVAEVSSAHQLTVLGFALMSNHYLLIVRTGDVELWRSGPEEPCVTFRGGSRSRTITKPSKRRTRHQRPGPSTTRIPSCLPSGGESGSAAGESLPRPWAVARGDRRCEPAAVDQRGPSPIRVHCHLPLPTARHRCRPSPAEEPVPGEPLACRRD